MAPETAKRTPLEKNCRSNAWAIVKGKALDVKDSTCITHEDTKILVWLVTGGWEN